jgi:putative zinc finger/helix-turn-helix YgiT family protein
MKEVPYHEDVHTLSLDVLGEGTIEVTGRVHVCDRCGEVMIDELYEELRHKLYRTYTQIKGHLTGTEIRALRKTIGLSKYETARLLDMHKDELERYESGLPYHPPVHERLLKLKNKEALLQALEEKSALFTGAEAESIRTLLKKTVQ